MEIEALLDIDLSKLLTSIFLLILSIIMYIITDILVFLFISFIFALIFPLNLYLYMKRYRREKRLKEIKNGDIRYSSIEIKPSDFISMARNGIPYSIIKLDNEYYYVSSIPYEDLESEKYKYICTINNVKYKNINSLINYKFNGKKLSDYDKIIIMEIDGKDPKEYY